VRELGAAVLDSANGADLLDRVKQSRPYFFLFFFFERLSLSFFLSFFFAMVSPQFVHFTAMRPTQSGHLSHAPDIFHPCR
jgi:hypothetical protein